MSIKSEIYIPAAKPDIRPLIPQHHPSLIMSDSTTDLTHAQSCGCTGPSCIKEKAWFYGPNGEVKTMSHGIQTTDAMAAQYLYNDSNGRLT